MRSSINIFSLLLAVTLLSVAGAPGAFAQGMRGTPEEQKAAFEERFAEMATTLELDAESSPRVKDILWAAQEKRMEMMSSLRGGGGGGGNLARNGMRAKMAEMDKETTAALTDVLTEDQLKKYQEIVSSSRRGRQGGQRRGQRAGNPQ